MLYEDPVPEAKLKNLSSICYGVGQWKDKIIPVRDNYLQSTTDFVANAHKYNLKVHAYTFRNEDKYLAWNYTQDPFNEYETFLNIPVDGYFTDFPATLKKFLDMEYPTPAASSPPCPAGNAPGLYRSGISLFSLVCIALLSYMAFV